MDGRARLGFIVNSVSGSKLSDRLPSLLRNAADGSGFDVSVEYTRAAGDGYALARSMAERGFSVVAAAGGDGTVNEVGRALVGTEAALGIVPIGSGNGLARHLGIPLDPERAVAVFRAPRVAEIDYGTANGLPFFCTCGLGFDARVGWAYARQEKHGFPAYLRSIVAEFLRYRPKRYGFIAQGVRFRKRAFLVAFGNAAQYGYDAFIAPEADIQDGLIDVSILEPFPPLQIPSLFLRLMGRSLRGSRFVQCLRAGEIAVVRGRRNLLQIDGEPRAAGRRITVRAHPRGLRVIVPESSPVVSSPFVFG